MDLPERTVETALVEQVTSDGTRNLLYSLSARKLLSMAPDEWGHIRDRASEHRLDPVRGLSIRCLQCGEPLFIGTRRRGARNLPLFSHHANAKAPCLWNTGQRLSPDQLRALQYDGHQESELHARLCRVLESAAKADPRYIGSAINNYRKPETHGRGRYPDVLVQWSHRSETAFEVQLSRTQQPEVAGREIHYGAEGVSLIWVLHGLDLDADQLPQSFEDIIRRHRGNAFVMDQAALEASNELGTIVLSCHLRRNDGGFEPPKLVTLDGLTYPEHGLPFLEDRISAPLLERSKAVRRRWHKVLSRFPDGEWRRMRRVPDGLKGEVEDWKQRYGPMSTSRDDESEFFLCVLVAFALSIAAHAANPGTRVSYVTKPVPTAHLINLIMQRENLGMHQYALIIRYLIDNTRLSQVLPKSVDEHLERAFAVMEGNLCLAHEAEWAVLADVIPEVFDMRIREQMTYLGCLPDWVRPLADDPEVSELQQETP
ncbi:hypothetical protein MHY87_15255 [Microvirga sp. ACRRW]|uniref:competence protein CoiA family protein n=1 Tax=Microvirga sp. ACRRW TaxID=2918205 RepID=UPI001EF435ED|nr:hypothetical protein [Microvirga sp. ACRRW]MCG7394262.1 hypothetical protein [Microvirga sp. ACRRW]